jgi:hypothetical protein
MEGGTDGKVGGETETVLGVAVAVGGTCGTTEARTVKIASNTPTAPSRMAAAAADNLTCLFIIGHWLTQPINLHIIAIFTNFSMAPLSNLFTRCPQIEQAFPMFFGFVTRLK